MSDLTPEQQQKLQEDNQTRAALRQAFEQFYLNLATFLQKLNMNPQIKSFCSMNLDQGAFWAREGIAAMQFNFQAQPPAPAPEGKPEGEKKEEAPKENCEEKSEEKPQE